MDALSLDNMFAYLSGQVLWWGLLVLMFSAMIEYVFPPFPGDTITVVGAMLIPNAGWPWQGVFAAVILGSMIGAAFDWWVGDWVARNEDRNTWLHRFLAREKVQPKVQTLLERFERRGSVYILLNRFIPAFRAFFFVAAGMAHLRLGNVLFFAAVSAAAWNGMLLGVGYLVGFQVDTLMTWVQRYTTAVWIILGSLCAAWLTLKLIKYLRRRSAG
ncbi:DedA family protein [Bradymonas sediminis]|nr:VTT domain-containing protein [Bradymonas sediminis]TDP75469.1 membrane protein DedA with SNARE-associated domain [Bradymonas sediminis]